MRSILPITAFVAAAALATSATAQQQDDATVRVTAAQSQSAGGPVFGTTCGTGTTTTFFAENNGFAGNMFDIDVLGADMTICAIDMNSTSTAGTTVDVEMYWAPTTAVGNESSFANWTLFATGSGTAAGVDVPTYVPLTPVGGSAQVFSANTSYGLYMNVSNYPTARVGYTNASAPVTYTGTHCDLTTLFGKGDVAGGVMGSTFTYREWNGTLYTDGAGPNVTLSTSGQCPGSITFTVSGGTGTYALLYGPAGTFTAGSGVCAGTTVDINPPTLGAVMGGSLTANVPANGCGLTVQAVDLGTCDVSNAIVL